MAQLAITVSINAGILGIYLYTMLVIVINWITYNNMLGFNDSTDTGNSSKINASSDSIHAQLSLEKSFTTIFLVFFVFLAFVLATHSWRQWDETETNYLVDMTRTVDSFVAQASITSKASLHVNHVFTNTHKKELIDLIQQDDAKKQSILRQEMNKTFFNLTGYMVVDDKGDLLFLDGPMLGEDEPLLVKESAIKNLNTRFFAHYFGESGGFYSISWFTYEDKRYGFIVRRPYNKFSEIIFNSGFSGYDLALYDKISDKVLITKHAYFTDKTAPSIKDIEPNVGYRQSIATTPWELLAIKSPDYLTKEIWKSLLPSIIILLIFMTVAFILKQYLQNMTRKRIAEASARRQIEQRAEKSLISIDEGVISTDSNKIITYANPKAISIFNRLGFQNIIGASLDGIWKDKNALWAKDLSVKELESLQEEQRELHLKIKDEELILEQSYNLLYEDGEVSGVVWLLRDVTNKVLSLKALEESRSRYKAIFDEAAVAHCILLLPNLDEAFSQVRIINANDAAIELFHAEDQQHLVHAFPQLIAKQTRTLYELITKSLKNGHSWAECEMNITDFKGNDLVLWVNISLHAGGNQNALITFIDITEREHVASELSKREQFWAKVMDQIVDIVYVISFDDNMDLHLEYCNRSVNALIGLPEPSGPKFEEWGVEIHSGDTPRLDVLIKKTRHLDLRESIADTCRVKDSQGNWRILRFTNTAFDHDENGLVYRYICSVQDITEEAEEQLVLIENERRYRLLAENVSDVIWAVNTKLEYTFISSSIYAMLGYTPDEIYRGAIDGVFSRSDLKKLSYRLHLALKNASRSSREDGDGIFKMDMSAVCKKGQHLVIEVQASYLWDEECELEGIFGVVRNVTEARQAERELLLAGQVFENSTEAIVVTDNTGRVIDANPAFFTTSQFSLEEVRGLRPDDIINPNFHGSDFYKEVGLSVMQESYWQGEVHYLRKNGEERVSWAGISATRNRTGSVQNLIIIISDITERKVIEEKVHKLAYFDSLTGLPNRSQMLERLDKMVIAAREKNTFIAVLFLDLDRFKPINDSMGHPAGDKVLKEVAIRLQRSIKHQDLICRMSGDEFTIALAHQKSADSAASTAVKVGERILHELQQPFTVEKRELFLTGSVGVAIFPHDGETVTELLKNSDMAMYHAKSEGRNSVQFFDEKMNKKAVELLEMENDLRYAVERNELELYYQPQFSASECKIQGVEALLRWHHPAKGLVPPGYFIPIIEDTGLIIPIGEWVLRQACKDMAQWQKDGVPVNRIAVNVSARQFKQESFIDLVRDVIEETKIDPNTLELELTESLLIDDLELTLEVLSSLRKMGVRMAIDDFGTGYSSLNYLKQFPVDTLKIDQSFIRNLPTNSDDAQITRTIISMAHNLGLGVIAEGVETKEQLEFLQKTQCEEVQGYLFSKPLPVKELIAFTQQLNKT